ncbi:unnamed protein product [Aspergillus oryzae]|uniref:Unnamed protein product n=2 Tax=Aspergillus oryzae TaxID=5062 RepID=A0AAN4YE87_ASPOZ|nr:unnamed protein product [Aspergillus oryzae]GMF93539.1 unnamed protein product [Aspergillus oryzae]GMG24442.1 unnamed protein product [Aspergillus oryzae]GMG43955.1 unnamed protein product [Aspergillus oryzae var. brunneus]
MFTSSHNPGPKLGSGNNSRPSSKDGPKKNIWSSMLDSVANGKRLPEKNLLILESQREFLDTLSADTSDPSLSNDRRKGRLPPVANQFALGYTYQDVLDADQEGKYDHNYTPSRAFALLNRANV